MTGTIEISKPKESIIAERLRDTLRTKTGLYIDINRDGKLFAMSPKSTFMPFFAEESYDPSFWAGKNKYKVRQDDEIASIGTDTSSGALTIELYIDTMPKKRIDVLGVPTPFYRRIRKEVREAVEEVVASNKDEKIEVQAFHLVMRDAASMEWARTKL